MTIPGLDVSSAVYAASMAMMAVAIILAFARLVRGPSLIDRVVALELMATLVVGMVAAYAVLTDVPALIDVAIVLALVAFIGAVAFARYAERAVRR